jgi:coenzyme PQQ precursor peptide PqqA
MASAYHRNLAASSGPIAEEEIRMAWTKPALKEIACGMEINMYAPADDEPVLF